jgi:hypothetical protein
MVQCRAWLWCGDEKAEVAVLGRYWGLCRVVLCSATALKGR